MPSNTTEFYFPWSCSSNSELGKHITTGHTWTPYKYTQRIFCILLTPQPVGPTNILTNCIYIPCFYITACSNIVINFCSMLAMKLKTVGSKQIWYFALSRSSYFWRHTCQLVFSFKLIKISFTKCFLHDYRQFIKNQILGMNWDRIFQCSL
jgi:hypothetical protein